MVRLKPYIPDRGDVVWITLHPQAGHEQAGRRPALVLSPSIYNRNSGLALLCPITNQKKGYPYDVEIPPGHSVTGVIQSDQLKSLDWKARNAVKIGPLPAEVITDVLEKLATLLDV